MKNIAVLTGLLITLSLQTSQAGEPLTVDEARPLACQEAERAKFRFETFCEEDFDLPERTTDEEYLFHGLDGSGDCGISVVVNRLTGKAKSDVLCD